jgi:hypothetical protein
MDTHKKDNLAAAVAGRKGGQVSGANRRQRAAALKELREYLTSLADTPGKRALVPGMMADYALIIEAEIKRPRSGKQAPRKRRPSAKMLAGARTRFTSGMWRIGAMPRTPKAPAPRYERRQDAPSEAAWRAEIKRRQWEAGNY